MMAMSCLRRKLKDDARWSMARKSSEQTGAREDAGPRTVWNNWASDHDAGCDDVVGADSADNDCRETVEIRMLRRRSPRRCSSDAAVEGTHEDMAAASDG
jgi:hypothetical protein